MWWSFYIFIYLLSTELFEYQILKKGKKKKKNFLSILLFFEFV